MSSSHWSEGRRIELTEFFAENFARLEKELLPKKVVSLIGGYLYLVSESSSIITLEKLNFASTAEMRNEAYRKTVELMRKHGEVPSSWAIRQLNIKEPLLGGAISLNNGWFLGVAGSTEMFNEAFCVTTAWRFGWMDDNLEKRIFEASKNPLITEAKRLLATT